MEQTKKPALLAVCRVLNERGVSYALIGGLALQVHQREPRTTLYIDIAVMTRDSIPRAALEAAGFEFGEGFEHAENWIAADGTPVQFSDDPVLSPLVERAGELVLDDLNIRVIRVEDLLHEKLRAGSDPARRRSKRLQDLADVEALLEARPELADALTSEERALLATLPD